jgi:MoaA/NifB/PqqE/SkfB family radical SAM enzyme
VAQHLIRETNRNRIDTIRDERALDAAMAQLPVNRSPIAIESSLFWQSRYTHRAPCAVQSNGRHSEGGSEVAQVLTGTVFEVPLSPAGTLTSVDVYISSHCNRRCTYCFLPSDFFTSGKRMSLDSFSDVVSWSQRHGVDEITLLGGEPSLHPYFAEMASLASAHGMKVRVVTNGARRFRRLLAEGAIGPHNLARVAVSLDSLDQAVQDEFRGPGAWHDAIATIDLLREHGVPFDINVTAVKQMLAGIAELIDFADQAGCCRVNVHWASTMGIGSGLDPYQIPDQDEWERLVGRIGSRVERRPDFIVEIERGFLAEGDQLTGCALVDFSNLQILPDGSAYRCGLLVDQDEMASLSMTGDQVRLVRPGYGEELLRSFMEPSCDACPVMQAHGRRACIYDKVSSVLHP